ncbi:hypothetical protein A3L12_04755 [Thermococcus sp. P6]|nr:hypothetical protein A3L12_04755 [Thermococcus sp. P6]
MTEGPEGYILFFSSGRGTDGTIKTPISNQKIGFMEKGARLHRKGDLSWRVFWLRQPFSVHGFVASLFPVERKVFFDAHLKDPPEFHFHWNSFSKRTGLKGNP